DSDVGCKQVVQGIHLVSTNPSGCSAKDFSAFFAAVRSSVLTAKASGLFPCAVPATPPPRVSIPGKSAGGAGKQTVSEKPPSRSKEPGASRAIIRRFPASAPGEYPATTGSRTRRWARRQKRRCRIPQTSWRGDRDRKHSSGPGDTPRKAATGSGKTSA